MNKIENNKTIVRIIVEMLKQGDVETIIKNTEVFFETERLQLELAYLNGISDFNKEKENFTDYYIRTYLKDLADALKIKTNEQESINVSRND